MASHSPKEDLFQKHYAEISVLLEQFLSSVVNNGNYIDAETALIGYIVDMYSEVFLGEVDYILEVMGFNTTPADIIEIRNGVDTSAFMRSNRGRLREILDAHVWEIQSLLEQQKDLLTKEEIIELYKNKMDRLALSETQMGIEKASVQSAKLFEEVTGDLINKTWNCVGDSRTCPTCLAMNGVTIPVTESFSAVAPSVDIVEQLSYTGGDIVYAHPRCRCWVTYSKA